MTAFDREIRQVDLTVECQQKEERAEAKHRSTGRASKCNFRDLLLDLVVMARMSMVGTEGKLGKFIVAMTNAQAQGQAGGEKWRRGEWAKGSEKAERRPTSPGQDDARAGQLKQRRREEVLKSEKMCEERKLCET